MYGEASGLSRKRRSDTCGLGGRSRALPGRCYPPPTMPLEPDLLAKKEAALARLRDAGSVTVALSGGVDSAVLLALAVEALGADRVVAVTGQSAAVPDAEIADAARIAATLGVRHEVLATSEMERQGYRANAGDRCYHCRLELFDVLEQLTSSPQGRAIAYGAIADDLGEDRPGMRAATERGVLAPLLEVGLRKDEIRRLAAEARLDIEDKPASPCLASRIPVGTEVSPERLEAVGRAEAGLRGLGVAIVRVRHHGDVARVETDEPGFLRLQDPGVRRAAVATVRAAGFRFVALDLEGYRSGSVAREGAGLTRIGPASDGGQ